MSDTPHVKGMDQVIQNLSHLKQAIVEEVVVGAQAVQASVINDARLICPVGVTGALAQSILPGAITITDDNVEAIVEANADYASYLEWGTRPHFPPVEALMDWAAKFLGDPKLAFVVARAIARRGTVPYNFMNTALMQNMDVFRNAMGAAVQRGIARSAA